METIGISKVSVKDVETLQKIGKQTFFETFSQTNTAEDMQDYLEKSFQVEKLRAEVENPQSEFYFAQKNGEIIGYLKINFVQAQTELQNENTVEIERIYVLDAYHGKKVGQKLYDKALAIAKEKNIFAGSLKHFGRNQILLQEVSNASGETKCNCRKFHFFKKKINIG